MSDEREVMAWDELGEGARDLAERIHGDASSPTSSSPSHAAISSSPVRVACDYVWRRTSAWITFPWSALLPVTEALAQSGRPVNG